MDTTSSASGSLDQSNYDIMQDVIQQAKLHSVKEMQLTKQYNVQNSFIRTQIKIFIVICVYILFLIMLNRLKIYMTFKDMINFVNNNDAYQQGVPKEIRSGYKLAYFYMNPNLDRDNFGNTNFPTAVVYSFYTWPDLFYKTSGGAQTKNLLNMYLYARDNTDASANNIICNSWGENLSGCQQACHVYPKVGVVDYISGALGMGMAGGFAAHGLAMGPVTAAGGALIGAGISVFAKYSDAQDNKQRCENQQNCAGKSC